jgi:amino acid transporter
VANDVGGHGHLPSPIRGLLELLLRHLQDQLLARWLLGFGIIWLFTLLNIRGAKVVGDSSTLFGIIVLAPFAIMTVLGLFQLDQNPFTPTTAGGESILGSLSLGLFVVMWNYYGWDGLSTVAGRCETRNATIHERC